MLFVSFVFNNRSIWLYYTLSECQSGGVIAQLLKPTFWFPPPFFQNIFFLDLVPPSKKLQMQTQIQTKTEKMTCIFFIERWLQILHLADPLLTPCWQLYKCNTLLTLCWHLADNCTSVTTWHFDILPMPEVFMQCGFSPGAVTKYFLMFTAIIGQSISTLILLKWVKLPGEGIRIQS